MGPLMEKQDIELREAAEADVREIVALRIASKRTNRTRLMTGIARKAVIWASMPKPPCKHCKGTGFSGGVKRDDWDLDDACEVCFGSGKSQGEDA